ncbi:MAG: GNAT family N-acetyltransferase [Pseudomonadota bacterium]
MYQPSDVGAIAELFHQSVHEGARRNYSATERAAWSPQRLPAEIWAERLALEFCWVADTPEQLIGFMTLEEDGYLNYAYVAPGVQGTGVAQALYERLEAHARKHAIQRLFCEASFLAQRLFLRQGWTTLEEQRVPRRGVVLTNFRMEKHLD